MGPETANYKLIMQKISFTLKQMENLRQIQKTGLFSIIRPVTDLY